MANCGECVKKKSCYWSVDDDVICSRFEQKKMTNRDRLNKMTDEELAKFISSDVCKTLCGDPPYCYGNCESQLLSWLRQELKA